MSTLHTDLTLVFWKGTAAAADITAAAAGTNSAAAANF